MTRRRLVIVAALAAAVFLVFVLSRSVKHETLGYDEKTADYKIEDAPDGGKTVRSTSGRFTAWIPEYPYRTNQTLDSPYGKIDLHAFSHDGMRISCTVSWIDRSVTDTRTLDQVFDETASRTATTLDGKVLERHETNLGGHRGIDLLLSTSRPKIGTSRVRAFVVGTRFYTLSVFMLPGADVDPEIDRFLDSLVVTDADGGLLRSPGAPPPPKADLGDVVVFFTQTDRGGTKRTLLVHKSGVVELLTGDRSGPVVRRMPPGRANLAKLEALFGGDAWRTLPEKNGAEAMYVIESHGHAVTRNDPLDTNERAFMDAMGALGELWIYAERAPRPGETFADAGH